MEASTPFTIEDVDVTSVSPAQGKICGHQACPETATRYISLNGFGIYSCRYHADNAGNKVVRVLNGE